MSGNEIAIITRHLDRVEEKVDQLLPCITILENEKLPERVRTLERWYVRASTVGAIAVAAPSVGYGLLKLFEWASAHVKL